MPNLPPLQQSSLYHIYNHAVGDENVFREVTNYEHFLRLYEKYITPVADTFAWVLMPNHFHMLVRLKEVQDLQGFENLEGLDVSSSRNIYNQAFSNLFNAYTKAFNKRYQRRGSLLCNPFRRKQVDTREWLRQLILYIHHNPVKHGFCSHPVEYPWSSYLSLLSVKPTKIARDKVIGWFDSKANFKALHDKDISMEETEEWLFSD